MNSNAEQKNVLMALLCYVWILVLVPLMTEAKNDPFVKFHIKQGLVLLIASLGSVVLSMIPILGWMILPFYSLGIVILAIIGVVNAVSGKEQALPLIGQYSDKIHI